MRRNSGNMLILVSVFMSTCAILVLLGSSFGALFVEESRLQQSANEIALAGARKLNENDRIGQMNNMIARCRQLVYCSSDAYSQVDVSYTYLRNLADQLAGESRDSAERLETYRHQLATLARAEAETAMVAKYNEIKTTYPMSLPWMKVSMPILQTTREGKLANVESNVLEMKGFTELEAHDVASSYLHAYPDMKLYKEDTDARLPAPNAYLHFKLSSLAAPVADVGTGHLSNSTIVAPARATLASNFRTIDSDELPSACQVVLKLKVGTTLGAGTSQDAKATGTAEATGGGLPL